MVDMEYIAIATSAAVSLFLANKFIDDILMLFHYSGRSNEKKYIELYNSMDDELYSALMKGVPNGPKNYADYLLLHQKMRPTAYKKYLEVRRDVVLYMVKFYGIAAVVLTFAFFNIWYLAFAAFVVVHLIYILDRKIIKKHDKHFYLIMMHVVVLTA